MIDISISFSKKTIRLFCDKKTTTFGGKKYFPTETFTSWVHKESGWSNIEPMAKDLQYDVYGTLLRKVAGVDLFAAEAHFHRPCYSKFCSKYQTCEGYHRSSNADENVDHGMLATTANAHEAVKALLQKEIITNQKVLSWTILRDRYIH